MSATNAFETDLLELIFNGTTITNIADNAASSPITTIYVSLHTGDPGETGAQNTSEATYTGYARIAVNRNSGGWTVSGNNVSNTGIVTFGLCSAGSNTITHFGLGTSLSGAGYLMFSGALDASLAVSAGITPAFAAGELDTNAD